MHREQPTTKTLPPPACTYPGTAHRAASSLAAVSAHLSATEKTGSRLGDRVFYETVAAGRVERFAETHRLAE